MYCLTVLEAGSRDQSVTKVDSLRAEEKKKKKHYSVPLQASGG